MEYVIRINKLTVPVSYYPLVVVRSIIESDELASLVNDKSSSLIIKDIKDTFEALKQVSFEQVLNGNGITLKNFLSIKPTLQGQVDENFDIDLGCSRIYANGFSSRKIKREARRNSTVTRSMKGIGSSVPIIPDTSSLDKCGNIIPGDPDINITGDAKIIQVYSSPYDINNHIHNIGGIVIVGENLSFNPDFLDSGVWIKSENNTNRLQADIISIEPKTIMVIGDVDFTGGPAGNNSVENFLRIVKVNSLGNQKEVQYSYPIRKTNLIDLENNKIFLSSSQAGSVAEVLSHEFNSGEMIRIALTKDGIYIEEDGEKGQTVKINGIGAYALIGPSGRKLLLNIENLSVLLGNLDFYSGFLQEVIQFQVGVWSFKTIRDNSTEPNLIASFTKTGELISWDFGNGDNLLDSNQTNYSGYIDNSEKTVSVFNVDDFQSISAINISSCSITSPFPEIFFPENIVEFDCTFNFISGQIPSLSRLHLLEKFEIHDNPIDTTIPDLSNCPNLVIFSIYGFFGSVKVTVRGKLPDISKNTELEVFYCFGPDVYLNGHFHDLSKNTVLTDYGVISEYLAGPLPDTSNNVNLVNYAVEAGLAEGSIPDISNNTLLQGYGIEHGLNITGSLPDFTNNSELIYLMIRATGVTDYAGGLQSCDKLILLYFDNNSLTSLAISDIVDDLFINRIALGALFCQILLEGGNNGSPDADAIAKIEGTAPYLGDGLKNHGCSVEYNP